MKLHPLVAPAALALASAGLLASSLPAPDKPGPGDEAPEIGSATWFNHIGVEPSLAAFRGQAILLEFWATW